MRSIQNVWNAVWIYMNTQSHFTEVMWIIHSKKFFDVVTFLVDLFLFALVMEKFENDEKNLEFCFFLK